MKRKQCLLLPLLVLSGLILFTGCEKDAVTDRANSVAPVRLIERAGVGLETLISVADLDVTVAPRSMGGYSATAKGKGTIPSGEYAGWKFHIDISAHYSGTGTNTLETGSALVKIRGEQYVSVVDPLLSSFCCGEGGLQMDGSDWVFWMYGQVNHSTAPDPHNHLFAGLATTAGTMNMTILDQSGTVVEQADPPHDPGIGEVWGFDAQSVDVVAD